MLPTGRLVAHYGWGIMAPAGGETRKPAETGALLVCGAVSDRARWQAAPVLEAISERTVWLGSDPAVATATRLKLVVNSWVLATVTGTAEAIALAEGLGLDGRLFTEAIAGGGLDSPYLQAKANVIFGGEVPPHSTPAPPAKDSRSMVHSAPTPAARVAMP